MTHTNFIPSASPKQHRALWRWYLFSLLFFAFLALTIIILSITRIRNLDRLRKERQLFTSAQEVQDQTFCQDRTCAQKQAHISNRMKLINSWQTQKEFPAHFLKQVTELLDTSISLEHIAIKGPLREITVSGDNPRTLTQWGQKISHTSWGKDLRMMNVQKKENKTIALFKKII